MNRLEAIRIAWVEDEDIEPEFVTAQADMKYLIDLLDNDFYTDYDKCQNRLIKTQDELEKFKEYRLRDSELIHRLCLERNELKQALRDIKSQALVAERSWLLSRADAALRKIR